jgi:poly-gamma-glutamate synthesis protein (capsule biosynthesis protein)
MASAENSAVLMFTGDIMCAVNHQRAAARHSYDFHDSFGGIKDTLAGADFTVGVLETICHDGAPYENERLRLENGAPNCNSPSSFLSAVADAGFDGLVTANNHCFDAGKEGLDATAAEIKKRGMKNIGTLGDNPVIVDVKGIKVGIIACTMIVNGSKALDMSGDIMSCVNILGRYDRDYFLELINTALANGAEYIVAYQHWGVMNSSKVRASQIEEAKFMAEAGADLIVGSHPHVLQRFDYVNTSDGRRVPCAFSLGNFLTTMTELKENTDCAILRAELHRNADSDSRRKITAKLSYIPCMSDRRSFGAAVVPTEPPFSENCRISLERTRATMGAKIACARQRPKFLLSGSAVLGRIFASGKDFRADKTPMLLSQLALGSTGSFHASDKDEQKQRLDIEKRLPMYLLECKPDYIAVDFLTAASVSCFRLGDNNDNNQSFFTNSKPFKQSEFYKAHRAEMVRIRPPFGENIWKPRIKNFAEMLTMSVPSERIILFRHKIGARRVKSAELRTSAAQDKINRFMQAMEEYFIELVNPAVVDISEGYFGEGESVSQFEQAYYEDAYKAVGKIVFGGRTYVSEPDAEIWFSRVMKYYKNMTARSYQSWLLDMDCAADIIIAQTSAEFAARNSARLIKLKRMGTSDLSCVKDFFDGDRGAEEIVRAAEIITALREGNLSKPYDFYAPAFKGHYNIIKTMVRLLSIETGASVNESSAELVFLLRGKPQLKRYISGLNRMTVDIWGSCVSRESINRSADAFIGKYIFKQTPILAYEPAAEIELPESAEAFCGSKWRRRTIHDSIARNGMEILGSSTSSWIILDFYDLICKMACYKGELFEIDDFICRTDFYKGIESDCTSCYVFEKRDMRYCFEIITRFANDILKKYGSNIILIKTEPKNSYITLDYRTAPLEDDGMFEIKKKFISLCEERFAGITGCYVIDISKHFLSSDSFPLGGAHIVHYEDEFYRQAGEYISRILNGEERHVYSTVDDNYLLLRSLKLNRD